MHIRGQVGWLFALRPEVQVCRGIDDGSVCPVAATDAIPRGGRVGQHCCRLRYGAALGCPEFVVLAGHGCGSHGTRPGSHKNRVGVCR